MDDLVHDLPVMPQHHEQVHLVRFYDIADELQEPLMSSNHQHVGGWNPPMCHHRLPKIHCTRAPIEGTKCVL